MNALDTRINALSNDIAGTSETNTQKKKGYTEDVDEREVVTGNMEAFEPDAEGNDDGVIVIDSEMIPDESTNAEVNVNEGMEVAETREAEGNAFKDLLKRESNVSEQEDKPITDDMEIRDQGGGGGGCRKG